MVREFKHVWGGFALDNNKALFFLSDEELYVAWGVGLDVFREENLVFQDSVRNAIREQYGKPGDILADEILGYKTNRILKRLVKSGGSEEDLIPAFLAEAEKIAGKKKIKKEDICHA